MATELVTQQSLCVQMKIFWARTAASIPKNMAPMQYAVSRSLRVGFAIRTTEHRMLIRANLWPKMWEFGSCSYYCGAYQRTEVSSKRSQSDPIVIWGAEDNGSLSLTQTLYAKGTH